jgi:stage II sporulation protein P
MKKGLAAVAIAAVTVYILMRVGMRDGLGLWLKDAIENGGLVKSSISMELGASAATAAPGEDPQPTVSPQELSFVMEEAPEETPVEEENPEGQGKEDAPEETEEPPKDGEEEETEDGVAVQATTIKGGLSITNDTGQEIDIASVMAEGLSLRLPSDSPQILIIHTHATEAYTPGKDDKYEATGECRTLDKDYNVVKVGDVLTEELEKQGLHVVHDRGVYDYPSYTGSYSRSGAAIESYLSEYPDLAVVIDLHRDALGTGDVLYKPMAAQNGETSAQLMLLVATGEKGLPHPLWRENLKLALAMQDATVQKYPTLTRPVAVKQERYNQHLTTGSLILEVGSSGNSLDEALRAVRLFADAVGPLLLSLAE